MFVAFSGLLGVDQPIPLLSRDHVRVMPALPRKRTSLRTITMLSDVLYSAFQARISMRPQIAPQANDGSLERVVLSFDWIEGTKFQGHSGAFLC
jgi:hypothetical protein